MNLKRNNNLHITKSDKGNNIVIMNKDDYISKCESMLSDELTYKKLTSNPLSRIQL